MASVSFEEPLLRSLERLRLATRRPREGTFKGDRPSTRRGTSVEFVDFRPYVPGDDLRQIDWHAYGRLDRPYVRLFREEEDISVHLLVDASRSMRFGRADKFEQALRIAAAIGYVALMSGDPVQLAFLGGRNIELALGGRRLRGRRAAHTLFAQLGTRAAGGDTDLNAGLALYARLARRTGLAVVVSDLMTPDGGRAGVTALQGRGFEVAAVQVLASEELAPELQGDLRLVDAESGSGREVTLDGPTLRAYRERVGGWLEGIREGFLARGVRYARTGSDTPLADLALRDLRSAGIFE
jgi:uncharacterized protein (DUF58 family)